MDNTKTYKSDGSADDLISTDELISLNGVAVSDGQKVQRVKAGFGTDGEHRDVDSDHPFPVSDAAAAALLAYIHTAIEALNTKTTGTVVVSNMVEQGLTDAQLRAAAVSVSGAVSVSNFPATQAVSGSVTANTGLSQPLTDAQLRAAAVPVSGAINVSNFPTTQTITGEVTANTGLAQPLTDAQLRAAPLAVAGSFATSPDDTVAYLLASILEKMPRVDTQDRLLVSHAESNPTISLATNQTLTTVGNVSTIGSRDASHTAYALANIGAVHIYNNILVS